MKERTVGVSLKATIKSAPPVTTCPAAGLAAGEAPGDPADEDDEAAAVEDAVDVAD